MIETKTDKMKQAEMVERMKKAGRLELAKIVIERERLYQKIINQWYSKHTEQELKDLKNKDFTPVVQLIDELENYCCGIFPLRLNYYQGQQQNHDWDKISEYEKKLDQLVKDLFFTIR